MTSSSPTPPLPASRSSPSTSQSLPTIPPAYSPPLITPAPRNPQRTVHFALDDDDSPVVAQISAESSQELFSADNDDDDEDVDIADDDEDLVVTPGPRRSWGGLEEDDYLNSQAYDSDDEEAGHRRGLLSDTAELAAARRASGEARVVRGNEERLMELLEEEQQRPKSGMRMAFMNMANSIIGAGIIGMPYSFRQAGLGMGLVLLVGLTVVVDWTIRLIAINTKLSGTDSFQATMSRCFGKKGLVAISIAQWAFAFGGCIAYCIIIGDTVPHVVLALFPKIDEVPVLSLLANRRATIVIFTVGISYPLTLYRDISKLAKASFFALVSMTIIVLTVLTQGLSLPSSHRPPPSTSPPPFLAPGIFQGIGVISFAFVCHHNSLLIYGSLRTPTLNRFATVTHYSTGISCIFCIIMALAGYLTFRESTAANVLNNFPSDNAMANFARLCFGFNMLTTLPLEAFVCREVMEEYFWPGRSWSLKRHVVLGSGLIFGAVGISLVTCDLGAVFELIGATSACALAYILPAACYVKLATRGWRTVAAWGVMGFGGFVMVVSLAQNVWKMMNMDQESVQCGW